MARIGLLTSFVMKIQAWADKIELTPCNLRLISKKCNVLINKIAIFNVYLNDGYNYQQYCGRRAYGWAIEYTKDGRFDIHYVIDGFYYRLYKHIQQKLRYRYKDISLATKITNNIEFLYENHDFIIAIIPDSNRYNYNAWSYCNNTVGNRDIVKPFPSDILSILQRVLVDFNYFEGNGSK